MKYYSERQVKKLLKEQIEECSSALRENRFSCLVHLPKGKEGNVYTYKQLDKIRHYDAMSISEMNFHLD